MFTALRHQALAVIRATGPLGTFLATDLSDIVRNIDYKLASTFRRTIGNVALATSIAVGAVAYTMLPDHQSSPAYHSQTYFSSPYAMTGAIAKRLEPVEPKKTIDYLLFPAAMVLPERQPVHLYPFLPQLPFVMTQQSIERAINLYTTYSRNDSAYRCVTDLYATTGVTRKELYRALANRGIETRFAYRCRMADERGRRARDLTSDGASAKEIARELHVSVQTVHRYLASQRAHYSRKK